MPLRIQPHAFLQARVKLGHSKAEIRAHMDIMQPAKHMYCNYTVCYGANNLQLLLPQSKLHVCAQATYYCQTKSVSGYRLVNLTWIVVFLAMMEERKLEKMRAGIVLLREQKALTG